MTKYYEDKMALGDRMAKKKDEVSIHSSAAEYLTYVAAVGDVDESMEMRYVDENIWLTQKMMAQLYDVSLPTINEHIKKIYGDSELAESATIRKFRIVQTEGARQVSREVAHYNLQMNILNGSYRIFVRYGFLSANFIKKLPTFMRRLLTMIKMLKQPDSFFRQCRTKCTGLFIDIQRQNLLSNELMRKKSIWD